MVIKLLLVDDHGPLRKALREGLQATGAVQVLGEAAIGKIFEISLKKGTQKIAGCAVTNGTIARDKKIRVVRLGKTVYDGKFHGSCCRWRQAC